jgi:hypothetical protein
MAGPVTVANLTAAAGVVTGDDGWWPCLDLTWRTPVPPSVTRLVAQVRERGGDDPVKETVLTAVEIAAGAASVVNGVAVGQHLQVRLSPAGAPGLRFQPTPWLDVTTPWDALISALSGGASSCSAVRTYDTFPGWVQEKGATATFAVTLDATPTDGNYLIAFADKDSALPAANTGWTSLGTHTPSASEPYAAVAYKGPLSGAAAAQTPFSGTAGARSSVVVMEVAGITDPAEQLSVSFDGAETSGNATTTVSATTTAINTLALAFSGWEDASPQTFTLALDAGWTGSHVSGPNTDQKAVVYGRQSLAAAGSLVTATTTTGAPHYGLTGALVLIRADPALVRWIDCPNTTALAATEALSANNLVNIHSGGMRKADKTLNREAHGYVVAAVPVGAYAAPQFDGKIVGSGLTPGLVYLGAAGAVTSTPATSTDMHQQVGAALSATEWDFQPHISARQD